MGKRSAQKRMTKIRKGKQAIMRELQKIVQKKQRYPTARELESIIRMWG